MSQPSETDQPTAPADTVARQPLSIVHTAAEGTLVDGTRRGDGTAAILKAAGWRWSPTINSWYVRGSRDKPPCHGLIDDTARRLRDAGFHVEVAVDATARPAAEVEADKVDRAVNRAEALAAKAVRQQQLADQADERASHIAGRIPFGQPVLVGHHSQRAITKHYEKVEALQRKAIDTQRQADDAKDRARSAAHTTDARYNPLTVANRISKLFAEIRATERALAGPTRNFAPGPDGTTYQEVHPPAPGSRRETLQLRHAQLTDQLNYWQAVRDHWLSTTGATNYGPDNVKKGDHVKIRSHWYVVVRANSKTVTVPSTLGGWTNTTPYHEIQDHRSAEQPPQQPEILTPRATATPTRSNPARSREL